MEKNTEGLYDWDHREEDFIERTRERHVATREDYAWVMEEFRKGADIVSHHGFHGHWDLKDMQLEADLLDDIVWEEAVFETMPEAAEQAEERCITDQFFSPADESGMILVRCVYFSLADSYKILLLAYSIRQENDRETVLLRLQARRRGGHDKSHISSHLSARHQTKRPRSISAANGAAGYHSK